MYLYSTSAGGKDLCNDTQIKVIGLTIYTKMLKTLSKKLSAKLPATTRSYSRVKIAQKINQNLKIFISAHAQAKMLQIAMLGARRTSCHAVNAFLTRSKLIWPISSLKNTKNNVQKTRSWQKGPGIKMKQEKVYCKPLIHCFLFSLLVYIWNNMS